MPYTLKQINKALSLFDQIENATLVCRQLGYPSVSVLYAWIRKSRRNKGVSQILNADVNIKFPQDHKVLLQAIVSVDFSSPDPPQKVG